MKRTSNKKRVEFFMYLLLLSLIFTSAIFVGYKSNNKQSLQNRAEEKDTTGSKTTSNPIRITNLQGSLTKIISDNFDTGESKTAYEITTANGKTYPIEFTGQISKLTSANDVIIKNGILQGDKLIIESPIDESVEVLSTSKSKTSGNLNIAVLMFKLDDRDDLDKDNPEKPFRHEDVEDTLFSENNPVSVVNYFKKVSYDKLTITGDVYGWFPIDINPKLGNLIPLCDYENWGFTSEREVKKLGQLKQPLQNYDFVIYVFPEQKQCDWLGRIVDYRSGIKRIWINGMNNIYSYVHETGHFLLGLNHAEAWDCNGKPVPANNIDYCRLTKSGDLFDIMRMKLEAEPKPAPDPGHINALYKMQLGWLTNSNTINSKNVDPDGYRIYPLEKKVQTNDNISENTLSQLLIIQKPNSNLKYYIEYRNPDSFAAQQSQEQQPGYKYNGVIQIRTTFGNESVLINPQAEKSNPGDMRNAYLTNENPIFYDPVSKIRITQVDKNEDYASVKVEYLH